MKRRYPAATAAALSMTAPAAGASEYLTVPRARKALVKEERKLKKRGEIEGFRIVKAKRTAPKRVRFYVRERLGDKTNGLLIDGYTGVWLRNGKTVIRYPGNRKG